MQVYAAQVLAAAALLVQAIAFPQDGTSAARSKRDGGTHSWDTHLEPSITFPFTLLETRLGRFLQVVSACTEVAELTLLLNKQRYTVAI